MGAAAAVVEHRLAPGGRLLPDEHALAGQLDASRNAVREALSILRDEGLLTRRRGVGTVVVTPTYGHGLDRLAGLAEALAGHGTVTNEVLLTEMAAAPPAEIAERLCLDADATAVRIERVRRVDGEPVSLDSTYLTADVGSGVLHADLETRDIFAVIEETSGCPLGRAEIEVRAASADPETTGALGTIAYTRSGQLREPCTCRTALILAGTALIGTPLGVAVGTLVSKHTFAVRPPRTCRGSHRLESRPCASCPCAENHPHHHAVRARRLPHSPGLTMTRQIAAAQARSHGHG